MQHLPLFRQGQPLIKSNNNWGKMVRFRRLALDETQVQFGRRFGTTGAAVSLWESSKRDVPGYVTWWIITMEMMSDD
jgi:DNA-binding transcriptional regulator YiaG